MLERKTKMRGKTNTITINGRTYDAATGKAVGGHAPKTPSSSTHKIAVTDASSDTPSKSSVSVPVVSASSSSSPKKAVHERQATEHARRIERSQTLMRHVVKKPQKSAHAIASTTAQPKRIVIENGKAHATSESPKVYTKSAHISKFAPASNVTKVTTHVPVTPAPAERATKRYDIANTPPAPRVIPDNKPLKELHRDLFETAIQNATSHTAKKHPIHKKHRRAARLTVSAASLLLLVAFFAIQNAPNLALKRASSTIGFTASIPGYHPSGFRTAGPVQYAPGRVTINFRSNSDDRAYTVTQVASNFTEQTLRSRFLTGQSYETVQNGKSVGFLYGNANYTWVRNGIWYNIEGDSRLSKDQLLRIASSLH